MYVYSLGLTNHSGKFPPTTCTAVICQVKKIVLMNTCRVISEFQNCVNTHSLLLVVNTYTMLQFYSFDLSQLKMQTSYMYLSGSPYAPDLSDKYSPHCSVLTT